MIKYGVLQGYYDGQQSAWCRGYSIPLEDRQYWVDIDHPTTTTTDINAAYRYSHRCSTFFKHCYYLVKEVGDQ